MDTAVDPNFDYMYKILIVGNSGVGKTAFLVRYCDNSFSPAFVATVGIDFKVKTVFRLVGGRRGWALGGREGGRVCCVARQVC